MNEWSLFPVADAHLHVNPVMGLGAEKVARLMIKNGVWFAALLSLPHWDYNIEVNSLDDYKRLFNIHVSQCREAARQGLRVSCFSGLHPAEIDRLIDRGAHHIEVLGLSLKILDFLFEACENGVIQGVGEIGRQHYSARPDKIIIAQRVLEYALEKSKDHGCLIQLHLENLKGFTAWDIKKLVERIGVNQRTLVFHHIRPGVLEEAHQMGFFTTTPAFKEGLEIAFERSNLDLLLIESDYVDCPSPRSKRSIEPWSLPSVEGDLLNRGVIGLNELHKINIDNIEKVFGVKY